MIGKGSKISHTAEINVENLKIGKGAKIGRHVVIEGHEVIIGREAFIDDYAYIGGGSAFDECAFFHAGDFLHMGRNSHVNLARGVMVGHECGIGVETKILTHGAYLSELQGFPVQFAPVTIGDRVWLPNAWVNPGVTMGNDIVVAARSLVNRDLPSGCLAGGIPARILREDRYPSLLGIDAVRTILNSVVKELGVQPICRIDVDDHNAYLHVEHTMFDFYEVAISGPATVPAIMVKNQLRRHGIRFRYEVVDGHYQPWEQSDG